MRKLVNIFKALSDETRLRIMNVLMERECCVCEVIQALEISPTRASRNLNILYNAGFLKVRRNGLWVLYSIDQKNIGKEQSILLENIRKQMKNDTAAKQDLIRLLSAERVGVECCTQKTVTYN